MQPHLLCPTVPPNARHRLAAARDEARGWRGRRAPSGALANQRHREEGAGRKVRRPRHAGAASRGVGVEASDPPRLPSAVVDYIDLAVGARTRERNAELLWAPRHRHYWGGKAASISNLPLGNPRRAGAARCGGLLLRGAERCSGGGRVLPYMDGAVDGASCERVPLNPRRGPRHADHRRSLVPPQRRDDGHRRAVSIGGAWPSSRHGCDAAARAAHLVNEHDAVVTGGGSVFPSAVGGHVEDCPTVGRGNSKRWHNLKVLLRPFLCLLDMCVPAAPVWGELCTIYKKHRERECACGDLQM